MLGRAEVDGEGGSIVLLAKAAKQRPALSFAKAGTVRRIKAEAGV